MRRLLPSLAALVLAGCADRAATVAGPDPAAAVADCVAATAEHVGKPAAALGARWEGPTPDGGGTVRVTDATAAGGERVHDCVVRADGSLAALLHVGR